MSCSYLFFTYLYVSLLAFYPNDFTYNWAAPVGDLLKIQEIQEIFTLHAKIQILSKYFPKKWGGHGHPNPPVPTPMSSHVVRALVMSTEQDEDCVELWLDGSNRHRNARIIA